MCGSLGNSNYTVITHVLAPSLTPRGGILVRMVSCGMVGTCGRSGKLSHSSDEIGARICSNVDSHVCVCCSAHCGCIVNGSVAMAAV